MPKNKEKLKKQLLSPEEIEAASLRLKLAMPRLKKRLKALDDAQNPTQEDGQRSVTI